MKVVCGLRTRTWAPGRLGRCRRIFMNLCWLIRRRVIGVLLNLLPETLMEIFGLMRLCVMLGGGYETLVLWILLPLICCGLGWVNRRLL